MGIHGLTNFIKSRVPQTMRNLKLGALHGRTVAIDGNVMSLKFHHSYKPNDDPELTVLLPTLGMDAAIAQQQANKVVLSWYRFLTNLRSYNINPIVVFDGSKRVSAKSKELERRFNARQLLTTRAENEHVRVERLESLRQVVTDLRKLDPSGRQRALNETHKIIGESTPEKLKDILGRDTSLDLSTRFAGLVVDFQAKQVLEEGTLSKRQITIAQSEAQAFTRALSSQISEPREGVFVEEPEEDALEALQLVLNESRYIASNYSQRATSVTKQTYTDSMEIIKMMGIPVLLTSSSEPQEAESLCASLVFQNFADMVLTEDTDVLAFEAPMLRHVGLHSREGDKIDGGEVREFLSFPDKKSWIDFCLLCGSDFTERIKGLGPVGAHTLMMKYGSIEEIFDAEVLAKHSTRIVLPDDPEAYLLEIAAARAIFLSPIPLDNYQPQEFELREQDPNLTDSLKAFGWSEDHELRDGFDIQGSDSSGSIDLDNAFGIASLGDSPEIQGATFTPSPADVAQWRRDG